jgi:ubiquinone/menaquinone biosynthesis C-methylase UbiE
MDGEPMTIVDKRGLLARPAELRDLVIELGCGPLKRNRDAIGVDVIDSDAVDLVGDAMEVLLALPPQSARLVTSSHFLEHVPDAGTFLDAMSRLLQPGGEIEIIVPHFGHPYFHSDPTHANRLGFGLYTMSYYVHDPIFRRKVPGYVRREHLTLRDVDLHFKSSLPFYGRHVVKRLIGTLFNSTRYLQELWEENLCYYFPCYEIRYLIGRTADAAEQRA